MAKPKGGIRGEFEGADLGDARLADRLSKVAEALEAAPGLSLPRSLGDDAALEAGYRFFSNERVEPSAVLAPHVAATAARVAKHELCVVAHDTTVFKFDGDRDGMGRLAQQSRGFLCHVALAVTLDEQRDPLGVLGVETWTRPEERKKREHPRKRQADPTRESQRWWRLVEEVEKRRAPQKRLLHVMDREADAFDILDHMSRAAAGFVVRFRADRVVVDDDASTVLAADKGRFVAERHVKLASRSVVGKMPRSVSAHPPRDERMARLAVHARRITLRRPQGMTDASKSLDVNLVTVEELEPPPGEAPVSWRLYTSEPINTKAAVLLVVDAYRARWRIEEYFKALKTGCALEKRQLGSLDAILNLLAVCMPIAWQMLALRARARRAPDDAATKVLTAVQVEILRRTARRPLPPKPTVQDALEAVASLGGHLKRNGSPGWITLGAGFEKLYILEAGFRLASQM